MHCYLMVGLKTRLPDFALTAIPMPKKPKQNPNAVFIDKELSWLAFNERVLQEAEDKSVPIIERARFLGIFSNNMDEFFRVRFADIRRKRILLGRSAEAKATEQLIAALQDKTLQLQQHFDEVYNEIIVTLARRNIFLINETQVPDEQTAWLRKHFKDRILPSLVPIFIDDKTNLIKSLKDGLTYLAIEIRRGRKTTYAVLEVPADELPRFVELPKQKDGRRKPLILLDNMIRYCLDDIFLRPDRQSRIRRLRFQSNPRRRLQYGR